jgi:hypothetical protein
LAKLKAPGARQPKPIPEAIEAFHTSVGNLALATRTKYQRVLRFFSTGGAATAGATDIAAYRSGIAIRQQGLLVVRTVRDSYRQMVSDYPR